MFRRGVVMGAIAWLVASPSAADPDERRMFRSPPSVPEDVPRDTDRFGWYVPDFGRLQTGGYLGQINIGIGYAAFGDVLNWKVGYGYVAPGGDSSESIHTLDTSLCVRPVEVRFGDGRWIPVFVGAGLLYVPGDQYELAFPARYTRYSGSYYRPTAVHGIAYLGTEVGFRVEGGFVERHALYYQVVVLDQLGHSYLSNRSELSLTEVFSSAIGYRMAW